MNDINFAATQFKVGGPEYLTAQETGQVIELVTAGGQVSRENAITGIRNSKYAGLLLIDNEVVAVCCLKNPRDSYRKKVFALAKASEEAVDYPFELGYIAIIEKHDGKGLCQYLLKQFLPGTRSCAMFATTRKPAMAHILQKSGFRKTGATYKEDLDLYVFDGDSSNSSWKSF